MYQLFGKKIKEYKKQLFEEQNGLCKICKRPLNSVGEAHLDHDHSVVGENAGRCRGLLCRACNVAEQRMKNRFIREGLKGKVDYPTYLRSLADYYEQDFTKNPIHQNFPNDFIKHYKRLQLSEMKDYYNQYKFNLPDGKITKEILAKDFSKQFKKYQKQL